MEANSWGARRSSRLDSGPTSSRRARTERGDGPTRTLGRGTRQLGVGGGIGSLRTSLGHRDNRQRAESYALELAGKLGRGADDLSRGKVTLAHIVLALDILRHRTPRRKAARPNRKQSQRRRGACRGSHVFLGKTKDPYKLSLAGSGSVSSMIRRRAGAIDAAWRSCRMRESPGGPCDLEAVEADCRWLRLVFAQLGFQVADREGALPAQFRKPDTWLRSASGGNAPAVPTSSDAA